MDTFLFALLLHYIIWCSHGVQFEQEHEMAGGWVFIPLLVGKGYPGELFEPSGWIYFKKQGVDVWYEKKSKRVGDIHHPLGHDGICWNLSGKHLWWWFSWTSSWKEKHVDGDHEFVFYNSKGKRLFWNWSRGERIDVIDTASWTVLQTASDDEVFLLRKEGKTPVQLFVFDQLISNGKWAEEYERRSIHLKYHEGWSREQRMQRENGFASPKEQWNHNNERWNQDPPQDLQGKKWVSHRPISYETSRISGETRIDLKTYNTSPFEATISSENASIDECTGEYSWHMLWHHGTASPPGDMLLLLKKRNCICSLFKSKCCWKEMCFILFTDNNIF